MKRSFHRLQYLHMSWRYSGNRFTNTDWICRGRLHPGGYCSNYCLFEAGRILQPRCLPGKFWAERGDEYGNMFCYMYYECRIQHHGNFINGTYATENQSIDKRYVTFLKC